MSKAFLDSVKGSAIIDIRFEKESRMKFLAKFFKSQSTARILCLGFMLVILFGGFLLWLPISLNEGKTISLIDAIFVSGSAVCVTGLTTVDVGNTFNVFGKTVVAVLIQIGGLGVASIGVLFILLAGKRISLKSRLLIKDAMNISGFRGLVRSVKTFFKIAFGVELVGAILSFFVFIRDYPFWKAIGISLFHSISSFNNAGFDILGGFDSLLSYQSNVFLNLVTIVLVVLGGLGFLVIIDICKNHKWKKFSLQTKIVICMTTFLLVGGTLLLKLTENITWLGAFFQSTISRTAGFSTFPLSDFTQAGLFVFVLLMFIGASPGSTGGGVKTTTVFVVFLKSISSTMRRNKNAVFHRRVSDDIIAKATVVLFFGAAVVIVGTYLLCVFEPDITMTQALVEVTSAFATVGSTTGITPSICFASKVLLIIVMFIGRLGPVTIACLLMTKDESSVKYTEENVMIG